MVKINILAFYLTLLACKSEFNCPNLLSRWLIPEDTIKVFSMIYKDTAYFEKYKFSRQKILNGNDFYTYNSEKFGSFVMIYDSTTNGFKLKFNQNNEKLLFTEMERFFSINGKDYKVFKIVENKGVIDGEVSYFFTTDFGLIISKSNTWKIGRVLNPNKENNDGPELTALIYKILTDDNFFRNSIPKSKINFTQPKFEK